MRYEGPIYRPPSEADSLLVQATVGCPHNKCSFCTVYKKGPRYRARSVDEVAADLAEAHRDLGDAVRNLFLPAGDSLAMPTADLAAICAEARRVFPRLKRITVYAGIPSILRHGPAGLGRMAEAGLCRLHVGLESGHDPTLVRVKKGHDAARAVRAVNLALEAGLELSLYVMLGLAGPEESAAHARATARVINAAGAGRELTLRLRTLVPKVNTLLLHQIRRGRFSLCTPHQVLAETRTLLEGLEGPATLHSDHYTNYLDLRGELPTDRPRLLAEIDAASRLPREAFRPDFIGSQ